MDCDTDLKADDSSFTVLARGANEHPRAIVEFALMIAAGAAVLSAGLSHHLANLGNKKMRLWLSLPFIGKTRIGFSVSDREIARAFSRKPVTAEEREKRAQEEAEINAKAQAFAERWTPIVSNLILIGAAVLVIWLVVASW
jgi:type II secretory pathway component PulF